MACYQMTMLGTDVKDTRNSDPEAAAVKIVVATHTLRSAPRNYMYNSVPLSAMLGSDSINAWIPTPPLGVDGQHSGKQKSKQVPSAMPYLQSAPFRHNVCNAGICGHHWEHMNSSKTVPSSHWMQTGMRLHHASGPLKKLATLPNPLVLC